MSLLILPVKSLTRHRVPASGKLVPIFQRPANSGRGEMAMSQMFRSVVTCIPTYDAESMCYLKSVSTGRYLATRDARTISASSTCDDDALWRMQNKDHTIIWPRKNRSLVYGPNWQDVGLSDDVDGKKDWLMKLIPSPKEDAPNTFELRCHALKVRLACSSNGDVDAVPVDDEEGIPEECQWEPKWVSGELCFISCRLDHSRLTLTGNGMNQVGFATVVDPINLQTLSSTTNWRIVECGDGSVEICSYDYKNYLALNHDRVTLRTVTGSAASDSQRWHIIRNAIRGVRIKSSVQGLYLGKVRNDLVVRDRNNAMGDAFLWSLDPVHECRFNAIEEPTRRPESGAFPMSIQVCSNGKAVVARWDDELFDPQPLPSWAN